MAVTEQELVRRREVPAFFRKMPRAERFYAGMLGGRAQSEINKGGVLVINESRSSLTIVYPGRPEEITLHRGGPLSESQIKYIGGFVARTLPSETAAPKELIPQITPYSNKVS